MHPPATPLPPPSPISPKPTPTTVDFAQSVGLTTVLQTGRRHIPKWRTLSHYFQQKISLPSSYISNWTQNNPPSNIKIYGSHFVNEGQFVSCEATCRTSDWHVSCTTSAGAGHIKVHTQLSHHLAQKQIILHKSEAQRLLTTVTVEWAPNTSKFAYGRVWFLSAAEVTKQWCPKFPYKLVCFFLSVAEVTKKWGPKFPYKCVQFLAVTEVIKNGVKTYTEPVRRACITGNTLVLPAARVAQGRDFKLHHL